MKNTFLPIYIWIFLFFFVLNSCSDREERRILIVHSYEESYVGYPDFNRLIDKEFRRNGVNADIRIVYLDCEAFRKNISKAGKVVSQVRCDFNEKGYQWWEFRYKTILLPGGGYKSFQNWLTVFI